MKRQNIEIHRGHRIRLAGSVTNTATRLPQDLTDWTLVKLNVRTAEHGPVILTKTGTIVGDPEDGHYEIILDRDDTEDLDTERYQYDVWRTDAANETPIVGGTLTLLPSMAWD